MQEPVQIGPPPWSRDEILEHIDEFSNIYSGRPIKDNSGGMKAPHMFAVWFMAKKLDPDLIVESGVFQGQSTWVLEVACPKAKLVSIDLDLSQRKYISDTATYSDSDFSQHDWCDVTDRSLAFFDDHQNAYKRLQQCKWFGFKHVIFEDNYPAQQGDCYSLKKAFAEVGFEPAHSRPKQVNDGLVSEIKRRFARLLGISSISLTPQYETARIHPNSCDSRLLRKNLEVYYEFPPVVKTRKTRWGDTWSPELYPTQASLLQPPLEPTQQVFWDEATNYTWICYARLK